MRVDLTRQEGAAAGGTATRDPVSSRILEAVDEAQDVHRGRGLDLDGIVAQVIQGPLSRRQMQGRPGVEIRVRELVGLGFLRLDRWGAYHITSQGWTEGMDRRLEDFTWAE